MELVIKLDRIVDKIVVCKDCQPNDVQEEIAKALLAAVNDVNYQALTDVKYEEPKLLVLRDKNGKELFENCIIYGALPNHTKKHFWNLGMSSNTKSPLEFEMISSTYGYVHSVQQKDLVDMILIGSVKENSHLLESN